MLIWFKKNLKGSKIPPIFGGLPSLEYKEYERHYEANDYFLDGIWYHFCLVMWIPYDILIIF